jgi:two-component system chemotaxis sensor kinase CheA
MNQTELLDQFILEARDCLEQIGNRLLEVEKNPTDNELLNDLFRQVHTLKGNCGLFEFKPLERVVHAGEDLLDRIRNGTLAYNAGIADALLDAMDFTIQMVDEIEETGAIDNAADQRAQALAAQLRTHLTPATASAPVARVVAPLAAALPAAPEAPAAWVAPTWSDRIPASLLAEFPNAILWRYTPEPECFFKGEDPWLVARQAPGLKHLHVGITDPWPVADELDCYRCNLDLVGLSDAPVAYLHEHFRYVPEQVELVSGPGDAPQAGAPAIPDADADVDAPAITAAPAMSAAQMVMRQRVGALWQDQLNLLTRPCVQVGTVQAVRLTMSALLKSLNHAHAQDSLLALPAQASAATLLGWGQQHIPGQNEDAEGDVGFQAEDSPMAGLTGVPGGPFGGPGGPGGAGGGGGSGDGARRNHGEDGHQKVLKVGQEKIDRLMDLIGEMVVAKNALPYLAQRAETVFQQRELAREIKAQYAVINRIAEDMQHAIMQVRMMPVGVIFQRFGRLVRDISKKLNKDVQLVVEGEETEADKNIIESLADPLIHIIRNSLDHGIELPEVRQRLGKPAQGTIRVGARQESDRVIIEITDDGAGINPQRVRAKAIERGLIPEDKAQTLTDIEAVQLIFLPGFSTADTISDLSGRGVGMDVVRTAVERINGHVALSSDFGKGTRLTLSLPLSMAVTNVMIIEAGGRRFGLPMDMIVETVRVHADDIHHFKQARTTVLRGRIVPLRPLHDLLALGEQPHLNEDGEHAVLVVRFGHENVGLLVDQFHGATDIILKPLEGVLAGLTGFAGTALMGDGSVLMILNPKELM